jgi:hypothetical protein
MYMTQGDGVQRPLTSGPRGWPAGQIEYFLDVYTVPCLGIIYAVGPGVVTIQTPRRPSL